MVPRMLVHVLAALLARIAVQREQVQALFVLHVLQELTTLQPGLSRLIVNHVFKGSIA